MRNRIAVSFETRDPEALARAMYPLWPNGTDYPRLYLYQGGRQGMGTVSAAFEMVPDPARVVNLLSELPFEVAVFESPYLDWANGKPPFTDVPRFGDHHFRHGWACAFKGAGHERLVSRRWLEHGPWRLIRSANDTSFVQFHDLGLDAVSAYAQAAPGHRRMGVHPEGGFLQYAHEYRDEELRGFYDHSRRVLEIVINGREVSSREMLDACAARRNQLLGPDKPLDNVAFVFLNPAEVDAHLPRLWLYGLECWSIIDGEKTRLDTESAPVPMDADR